MAAKRKLVGKNRVKKTSQDVALDRLYQAAAAYVKSRGGKLVVVGGVSVQQWPGDLKFNWTLGIRCTGQRPIYAADTDSKHGDT